MALLITYHNSMDHVSIPNVALHSQKDNTSGGLEFKYVVFRDKPLMVL